MGRWNSWYAYVQSIHHGIYVIHIASSVSIHIAFSRMKSSVRRLAHKWAAPTNPNMEAIKRAVTDHLSPIYFSIRGEQAAGPWNTDENFYGIICSAKFEGKSRSQMNEILLNVLSPLKMHDRCRFSLEPPSRWDRLYRKKRWRWGVDT